MATDIMATSTTKLTHPIRLARSFRSIIIKMRLASLGAQNNGNGGPTNNLLSCGVCNENYDLPKCERVLAVEGHLCPKDKFQMVEVHEAGGKKFNCCVCCFGKR